MGKKEKRIFDLCNDLVQNPFLEISYLADKYDVSEMTIRRDLKQIEEDHMVNSLHPKNPFLGASTSFDNSTYDFNAQNSKYAEAKERIAKRAVELIQPNDTIILDTGTTVHQIAQLIPHNMPLTIILYNLNTLPILCNNPNINIILAGGYYHKKSESFESDDNINLIKRLRAAKMFVSTSGVETNGLTCSNQYEVLTKEAAIQSSIQKILVTDSSKFGVVKSSLFSSLEEMDIVISDDGLSDEWKEYMDEHQIQYELV